MTSQSEHVEACAVAGQAIEEALAAFQVAKEAAENAFNATINAVGDALTESASSVRALTASVAMDKSDECIGELANAKAELDRYMRNFT